MANSDVFFLQTILHFKSINLIKRSQEDPRIESINRAILKKINNCQQEKDIEIVDVLRQCQKIH